MSFLWRKKKCNSLTDYGNPSPTDQDINIEPGFAQSPDESVQTSIERTSLSAFFTRKLYAGMTVEAALALPVFLFFLLNLGCAIEMIRLHGNLQTALWETGHRLAVYGYALDEEESLRAMEPEDGDTWWKEMAGIAFSYAYVKNQVVDYLGEDYLGSSPLSRGVDGLQFWESKLLQDNDEMEITLTYEVSPWCSLTGFLPFRMANRCHAHIWNGYDIVGNSGGKEEELITVYVAETGTVYHEDKDCTHLRLSIREIAAGTQGTYRNESGGRYSECEKCRGETVTDTLYIAREGDCFHYSRDCSGLKRTVFAILLKDAGDYRPCSRCAGTS
ncbi:MAG: hypothetical protein NC121_07495 [Blautia sp.]|nr:hypothetical protein [Blautia sp.]